MSATVWIGKPGIAWAMNPVEALSGLWHPLPIEQAMIARTPGQLWERVRA